MGCCNGSVLVLVICTLQLISTFERLVIDFMGYLYLALIPNFIQLVIIIVAVFGLCLYKYKLLFAYLVWAVIFIGWNIFVLCIYLEVGVLDSNSLKILSFGTSRSWWVKLTAPCVEADNCFMTGAAIEVLHAVIQIALSLFGGIASAYVIYTLKEKNDPNPIFQVYKVPSSRRSSVSLRLDRDSSVTRADHWEIPPNARDSLRSNRSTRSNRSVHNHLNHENSTNRQSKRSSRGSTRSRNKSGGNRADASNGVAKTNKPWLPTIAPSSAVESDNAQSPLNSPTNPHMRGHENESYGYGSSSENPYSDHPNRQQLEFSPGPPPGPAPAANRRGNYRPTNLSQSFNAVADLPPPLDEGPEAYSREDNGFPPPPPLSDGPEPYGASSRLDSQRNTANQPSHHVNGLNRPSLHLDMTKSHSVLSSPSSPSSSSVSSTAKSGRFSELTPEPTPVKTATQNKADQTLPLTTQNLRAHSNAQNNLNHNINPLKLPPPQNKVTPASVATSSHSSYHHHHHPPYSQVNILPKSPIRKEHLPPLPTAKIHSNLSPDQNEMQPQRPRNPQHSNNLNYPTTQQSAATPKDNTFRRIVAGNISMLPISESLKNSPQKSNPDSLYSRPNKQLPALKSPLEERPLGNGEFGNSTRASSSSKFAPPMNANSGQNQNQMPNDQKTKSSIPPWERNQMSTRTTADQSSSRPQVNNEPKRQELNPNTRTDNPRYLQGTLTEVTSSYGGLYSSRQSPAARRRSQYREKPNSNMYEMQQKGQNHMSHSSPDYANHYANATDDVKTNGPFVSSSALLI